NFKLPDLQGFFLRGVDLSRDQHIDQDRDARFARYPGGNQRGRVGSFQGYATALPAVGPFGTDTRFRTDLAGQHTHNLFFELNATRDVSDEQDNTVAYPGGPETDAPMRAAGDHVLRSWKVGWSSARYCLFSWGRAGPILLIQRPVSDGSTIR